jgi:hypothetical protein
MTSYAPIPGTDRSEPIPPQQIQGYYCTHCHGGVLRVGDLRASICFCRCSVWDGLTWLKWRDNPMDGFAEWMGTLHDNLKALEADLDRERSARRKVEEKRGRLREALEKIREATDHVGGVVPSNVNRLVRSALADERNEG